MNLKSAKFVYFSPTSTTEKVMESIARGLDYSDSQFIDLTLSEDRKDRLKLSNDELLVIGLPVYGGRVPNVIRDWLSKVQADNTPTVCVSVYGERSYGDHMIEMKCIMRDKGCNSFAHAAFLGQHSFIYDKSADYRPNDNDLARAEKFGIQIKQKIALAKSIEDLKEVFVPGQVPSEDKRTLHDDFIQVKEGCTNCGTCFENCPVNAIDEADCSIIDTEKCIVCCACIKSCPLHVKQIKKSKIYEYSVMMKECAKAPKEVEIYL